MDPFQKAVARFKESDNETQIPFVELYEDLLSLPRTHVIKAILKKMADFGINERTKYAHRFLPATSRQRASLRRLLGLETASLSSSGPLPQLPKSVIDFDLWEKLMSAVLPQAIPPSLPPQPSSLELKPWRASLPPQPSSIIVPDWIPAGRVDYNPWPASTLGQQLKDKLMNDLLAADNLDSPVREFMELIQGIGESSVYDTLKKTLEVIERYGWTPGGFLVVPDRGKFMRDLINGNIDHLTISGKQRLRTSPLVISVIRNLIQELQEAKRPSEEIILEFKESIDGITIEEPIVKKEMEIVFSLLGKIHLVTQDQFIRALTELVKEVELTSEVKGKYSPMVQEHPDSDEFIELKGDD